MRPARPARVPQTKKPPSGGFFFGAMQLFSFDKRYKFYSYKCPFDVDLEPI